MGQPVATCIGQNPRLMGLEITDFSSSGSTLPVDVLIGSDYYWELVAGSVSRGSSRPNAIYTKLGWVFSGTSSHIDLDERAMNHSITNILSFQTALDFSRIIEE